MKLLYGISIEDYNKIYLKQKGQCAICGKSLKLFIDHDHVTGIIRGLLCHKCNTALGLIEDSKEIAKRMVSFLSQEIKP